MSARKVLLVGVHRGALQEHGPDGPPIEDFTAKIAARLNGEAPKDKGSQARGRQRGESGEATRTDTPEASEQELEDPLAIDDDDGPEADLLPDGADRGDGPDVDDDRHPDPDERQAEAEQDDSDFDPLDEAEEDPGAPLGLSDIAEALEVDMKDLRDMRVPVKIQGKVESATLEEVIQGYQRQSDYSSKSAALAREREEFQGNVAKVKEGLSAQLERFDLLAGQLEAKIIGDKKLLTDELFDSDPDKYHRIEREIKRNSELFSEAARARLEEIKGSNTEAATALQNRVVAEFEKLKTAHPKQFGDEARAKKTLGRLQTFAESAYGIPADQFNKISEAAHVEILMDAMRWKALHDKKPGQRKRVSQTPRMGRAGRASERGEHRAAQRKQALGKLRRTGTTQDAAAALRALGIA